MTRVWNLIRVKGVFCILWGLLYSQWLWAQELQIVEKLKGSGVMLTLVTLAYLLILIVLSWINYDQRKVTEKEFKQHRSELEKLVSERTDELQQKNIELENKILEIKRLQNSIISQKKLASLGKLSAGIAHEIKNPLNMINNSAKVILDFVNKQLPIYLEKVGSKLDISDKSFFVEDMNDLKTVSELIITSGQRANSIINNMLSQVRHGKPDLKMASLQECLNESLNLVYHTMRALHPFNLTISKEYDPIPKTIFGYEDMERAFINIFENSFYALREKIKISDPDYKPSLMVKLLANGEKIDIIIEDNGIGIKNELLENIMEPFFSTKPPGEGTGLGLSMVNDIVTAHRGEIRILSEEGNFTKVLIELPALLKEKL